MATNAPAAPVTPAPPAPPFPAAPQATPKPPGPPASGFTLTRGIARKGWRVGIYGPGGVGKTSLVKNAELIGKRVGIIDLENGSLDLDVPRLTGIETWEDLLKAVRDPMWNDFDVVAIDTLTKAESMAGAYTIKTVKHEKGHTVTRLEDYGFGKGLNHVFETMQHLFPAMDAHFRAGRIIVPIMHDCVVNVPNPDGDDFMRYEPRLQCPKSGNISASVRHYLKEWCDILVYAGYDVAVNKEGKGQGSGTRTLYMAEKPWHWAKGRGLPKKSMPYEAGSADFWAMLAELTTTTGKDGK